MRQALLRLLNIIKMVIRTSLPKQTVRLFPSYIIFVLILDKKSGDKRYTIKNSHNLTIVIFSNSFMYRTIIDVRLNY